MSRDPSLDVTSLPRHHHHRARSLQGFFFFSFYPRLTLLVRARMRQSDEAANVKNCTGTRERCRYAENTHPGGCFFFVQAVLTRNVVSLRLSSLALPSPMSPLTPLLYVLHIKYDPIRLDFMLVPRCTV